jgi:holo-ACP synthase CitX
MVNNILEFKAQFSIIRKGIISNSKCLLQITANIPGPDKHIYPAKQLFDLSINNVLNYCKLKPENIRYINYDTPIMLCVICCEYDPKKLKLSLLNLEEMIPISKYWDFDVFASNLELIKRTDLNYSLRRCFICELPAKVCSANQTHPINILIDNMIMEYNKFILSNAFIQQQCQVNGNMQ